MSAPINVDYEHGRVGARPIFFDGRGTRWKRIRAILIGFALLFVGAMAYLVPKTVKPLWHTPTNTAVGFAKNAAYNVQGSWPIIGNGELLRVVQIKWEGDRAFAADPFSKTGLFRELNADERETVRGREYAIEKYGQMPAMTLALTFDDGPDPTWTRQVLDVLASEHVQATFFDIGTNMAKDPGLVQREINEGHLVGNHTLTHIDFDKNSSIRGQQEWILNDHISRAITSVDTKFARLPYGGSTDSANLADNRRGILAAQQLGYYVTCFDVDTDDWKWKAGHPGPLPDLSDRNGHVVLMHDAGGNRSMTVPYLRNLIDTAKAQGYHFSTVAALAPHGFEAPQRITPSLADHVAYWAAKLVLVLPAALLRMLFDLNVVTIGVITAFTLVLAFASTRLARRRRWSPDYQPTVSVVIAAYNEDKVIARTLEALTHSTYRGNYEVIVVNDGSSDRTLGLLLEIAARWNRDGRELRVLNQPNRGKWAALNNGIEYASSDVIVTLDADTIFLPDTMGCLVRHFENPDMGAVAGVIKVGNVSNLLTAWQSLDYISGVCTDRMAQQLVGGIMIVPGACAAWRKEAILAAGGYSDATLAEDQDLTLAIHKLGFKIVQENKAVALTEAPSRARDLIKQRFRWTFGSLQAMFKNRNMFLRPRYGGLGLFVMPYTATSILIPLIFMPVTYFILGETVLGGHYRLVLGYAALFLGVHFITTTAAVLMLRERWWHLLVVPFYRLINEPLRAYLLYATVLTAMRGRAVGWNKIRRSGDVTANHLSLLGPPCPLEERA